MPGPAPGLRRADRAALAVLGLLLALSVCGRLYAYGLGAPGPVPAVTAAEPRAELPPQAEHLPWADGASRAVRIDACAGPVTVALVEPLPRGRDTLLAPPPGGGERVFYAYQGWILRDPCAALKLSALHVLRRAGALVGLGEAGERDARAVKVSVPAACHAAPDAVMAALRDAARP